MGWLGRRLEQGVAYISDEELLGLSPKETLKNLTSGGRKGPAVSSTSHLPVEATQFDSNNHGTCPSWSEEHGRPMSVCVSQTDGRRLPVTHT